MKKGNVEAGSFLAGLLAIKKLHKLERVAYKKEPRLNLGNWVVAVKQADDCMEYEHCDTKKEAREFISFLKHGQIAQVFRITDSFVEAWAVVDPASGLNGAKSPRSLKPKRSRK